MAHIFDGENAYTEDGFLIFNLKAIVTGPIEDIWQQIANFFTKFGSNNVRRIEDGVKRSIPAEEIYYASEEEYMIEFVCPRAAAKALQRRSYKVGGWDIRVMACVSWDQPNGQKVIQQLNNYLDMNVVESNNPAPILTLNGDCLEHICKLLPLPDQINFALSCQRFCTILASLSRIHMNNFDAAILERLTPIQTRIFLQIVGPQVKSVTVAPYLRPERQGLIFSLLAKFLINVEKVTVHRQNNTNNLSSFGKNMHSLQVLEMEGVHFNDEFIKSLEKLEDLKRLKIVNNIYVTGSAIAKLTGLEKLVLKDCRQIASQFKDIFKNLTNLYHLELCIFEPKFDTVDYEHIVKYLVHLKILKIVCRYGNCNCLAELPNLKVLGVILYTKPEKFFVNLAEHQANQLEQLRIGLISGFAVDDAVSVSRLKNLKVLKCDVAINDDIIEQFSNLNQLENIEVYEIEYLTDDGILNLLKCCLKLKRVLLWCYLDEKENLLIKLRKLLKQQIDQGERNSGVELVFLKSEDRSIPFEQFELADVLKVTEKPYNPVRVYEYFYQDYDDYDYDYYGNSSDES